MRRKIPPPTPPTRSKRKQSPGGRIVCWNGHIGSRRRFNMALKLGMKPTCGRTGCGAKLELNDIQGIAEIRGGGGASAGRLIFNKKRGKLNPEKGRKR